MQEDKKDVQIQDYTPAPAFTINNRLIVEAYVTDKSLKSVERNGFAMISQKVSLKGLKVLVDARLHSEGRTSMVIPRGSVVYVKEEVLHNAPFAKQVFESSEIEGKFIIVDLNYIELVVPK